jgi:hypothetical protein
MGCGSLALKGMEPGVSSQIKCERELAIREWCKFVMIRMHLRANRPETIACRLHAGLPGSTCNEPKSRHLDLPSTAEDELLQRLHRVRHFAQR